MGRKGFTFESTESKREVPNFVVSRIDGSPFSDQQSEGYSAFGSGFGSEEKIGNGSGKGGSEL